MEKDSSRIKLSYLFNEQNPIDTSNLSGLNPKVKLLAIKLMQEALKKGIKLKVTSGIRSRSEQEKLYNQGRTTEGPIVTNAKPGTSKHEDGLAFDVGVVDERGKVTWPNDLKLWDEIGSIGESIGLNWGGRFSTPDRPHFEFELFKDNPKQQDSYKRMKIAPEKNLQEAAKIFLKMLKGKPYGSSIKFTYKGEKYKAVLEEHSPSEKIPQNHPGISLFKITFN